MVATRMPHEDAFQYVQARRFCVAPNSNFQRQIEAYEDIHRASLSMAHFNQRVDGQQENGERRARRKRTESSQQDAGDTGDSEDEELKERNLLAQRRRNDDADQMARYIGDT
jgi:serine/threonine/tyrosine-interacting protein